MKTEDNDIFDFIMKWKVLKPFQPMWNKYRELILYVIFGGLTVFLAIVVYFIADTVLRIEPLVANAISWVIGVTFSFLCTRRWVFRSRVYGGALLGQAATFFGARLATLMLQEALIYILVDQMKFLSILVKLCTEIINIILNYLASKFLIFKKKG